MKLNVVDMNTGIWRTMVLLLAVGWTTVLSGQTEIIKLVNPSFEQAPAEATVPRGWMRCSEVSTPDILPGPWGVDNEAHDGETYVGIITRANGTYEHLVQLLTKPLQANQCYKTHLYLAHSYTYYGYTKPIKLRIWLGHYPCNRAQLIYESPFVDHKEWKRYEFEFVPKENYQYIYIEAWYKALFRDHKGNILIDGMGDIVPCSRA